MLEIFEFIELSFYQNKLWTSSVKSGFPFYISLSQFPAQ